MPGGSVSIIVIVHILVGERDIVEQCRCVCATRMIHVYKIASRVVAIDGARKRTKDRRKRKQLREKAIGQVILHVSFMDVRTLAPHTHKKSFPIQFSKKDLIKSSYTSSHRSLESRDIAHMHTND